MSWLLAAAVIIALLSVAMGLLVAFCPWIGVHPIYRLGRYKAALWLLAAATAGWACASAPGSAAVGTLVAVLVMAVPAYFVRPEFIIVAVREPVHFLPEQAPLGDDEPVTGASLEAGVIAWPLRYLIPHHLMNDEAAGEPVLAAY